MRRTLLTLGGVVMLLATACGSSHPTSTPTTASTPAPTPATTIAAQAPTTIPAPTTTAPHTAAVPATITVAYVNAVLAQLNHVYGDAVRRSVVAGRLTSQAANDLKAIYSAPLGAEEKTLFSETVAAGLGNIRPVPGDPITSVQKLLYTSASCIYAKVQTNSDPILIRPLPPLADEFMGLRHPASKQRRSLNPTSWIFFFDLVNKTPTNVPNQCPAP